jgi:ABC-type amino acid transport substrate-binding protein
MTIWSRLTGGIIFDTTLCVNHRLLDPEPYVIAVGAGSTDLHRVLDDTLAAMETDGALPALRAKWFGEAAR